MSKEVEWDFGQNAAPRSDSLAAENFGQTPSQTVGPYFHYGLPWKGGADLVGDQPLGARPDLMPEGHFLLNGPTPKSGIAGERIELTGVVFDGDGQPIPDSLVEIWQANAAGRYASADDKRGELPLDADFTGFGRCATSPEGVYRFVTVKPGRVPGPGNSLQAPHIAVSVFARGMLNRVTTRVYFEDEAGANGEDPILALVPEARRPTLIARKEADGRYRLDIRLQGEGETVFFDV